MVRSQLSIQGGHGLTLTTIEPSPGEGGRQRLETCLGSIVEGMGIASWAKKEWKAERDKWNRKREEERNRRNEEELRRQKEKGRKDLGERGFDLWVKSRQIRPFVEEVRLIQIDLDDDVSEWLKWAENVVENMDPLVNLFNREKDD